MGFGRRTHNHGTENEVWIGSWGQKLESFPISVHVCKNTPREVWVVRLGQALETQKRSRSLQISNLSRVSKRERVSFQFVDDSLGCSERAVNTKDHNFDWVCQGSSSSNHLAPYWITQELTSRSWAQRTSFHLWNEHDFSWDFRRWKRLNLTWLDQLVPLSCLNSHLLIPFVPGPRVWLPESGIEVCTCPWGHNKRMDAYLSIWNTVHKCLFRDFCQALPKYKDRYALPWSTDGTWTKLRTALN